MYRLQNGSHLFWPQCVESDRIIVFSTMTPWHANVLRVTGPLIVSFLSAWTSCWTKGRFSDDIRRCNFHMPCKRRGLRLNIKMSFFQYRHSHYKDKTFWRPSYLYHEWEFLTWNGGLYTEKGLRFTGPLDKMVFRASNVYPETPSALMLAQAACFIMQSDYYRQIIYAWSFAMHKKHTTRTIRYPYSRENCTRARFNIKTIFTSIGIQAIEITRPWNCFFPYNGKFCTDKTTSW